MARLIAVALAATVAVAMAATPLEQSLLEQNPDTLARDAREMVTRSMQRGHQFDTQIGEMCTEELEETATWLKEGAKIQSEGSTAEREALALALEQRADSMKDLLSQLHGLRSQLEGHMQRVTSTFTAMHQAMEREVVHNARTLESLGVAFGNWHVFRTPAANPIKPHAADEAIALLEVAVTRARSDAHPTHVTALDAVYANFKRAVSLWEPINVDFEHERRVLTALDAELQALIKAKTQKRDELRNHAQELRGDTDTDATTKGEPQLEEAFEAIRNHETVVTRACSASAAHAKESHRIKQHIIVLLNEHRSPPPTATGIAAPELDAVDPIALPDGEATEQQQQQQAAAEEADAEEAGAEVPVQMEEEVEEETVPVSAAAAAHAGGLMDDLLARVLAEPAGGAPRRNLRTL